MGKSPFPFSTLPHDLESHLTFPIVPWPEMTTWICTPRVASPCTIERPCGGSLFAAWQLHGEDPLKRGAVGFESAMQLACRRRRKNRLPLCLHTYEEHCGWVHLATYGVLIRAYLGILSKQQRRSGAGRSSTLRTSCSPPPQKMICLLEWSDAPNDRPHS